MSGRILLAFWFLGGVPALAQAPGFTLLGRITTENPAEAIRIVLEDPKARNAVAASVDAGKDGEYEIRDLPKRAYRLVTYVNGKRQDRRSVEILCREGSLVLKDFHFGRSPDALVLHFPAEDPDVVDVAELHGDYSRDVLRDYEKAFQDHINGNASRAIERLEAIAARAPGFYGAHARLGLIYQQEGCYFNAEAEYIKASALSSRSVQPLLNLASVQIRAADLPGELDNMVARALDNLKKALELRPGSALSFCLMGAAHAKIKSYEEAEKNFQRALELDGDLEAARLLLADLYLKQQQWDAGIENLETYLEDYPFASERRVVKEMLENARRNARDAQE